MSSEGGPGSGDVEDVPSQHGPQGPENLETVEAVLPKHQDLREDIGEMETSIPEIAPPSPPSTNVDILEKESRQQSPPYIQSDTGSPSVSSEADSLEHESRQQSLQDVQSFSGSPCSASSQASSSTSDQKSSSSYEGRSDEANIDGALSSGPASDYGLDGAVFSRAKRISEGPSPSTATDKRKQTGLDPDVDDLPKADTTSLGNYNVNMRNEGEKTKPTIIQESAHEFQFLGDQLSTQVESFQSNEIADKQLRSSSLPASEYSQEGQWEDRSTTEVSKMSSRWDSQSPGEAAGVEDRINVNEMILDKALSDDVSLYEPLTDVAEGSQNADPLLPVHEDFADEKSDAEALTHPKSSNEITPAEEISEQKLDKNVESIELKTKKIEIIDLESDDEEEEEEPTDQPLITLSNEPLSTPRDVPLTAMPRRRPSTPAPAELKSEGSDGLAPGARDSLTMENAESSTTQSDSGAAQMSRDGSTSSQSRAVSPATDSQEASPQLQGVNTSPKTILGVATEGLSPFRIEEELQTTEEPEFYPLLPAATVASSPKPEDEIEQTVQGPVIELPSTVPDSVQQESIKSQLLTPDTTQQISFGSQASVDSLHSPSTNELLPTPRLTQGNSADLVVPTAPSSQQEESSSVQGTTRVEKDDLDSTNESQGESVRSVQKAPTFVEKLKAMRRLSSRVPHKMRENNAASPWFVATGTSQIVPNSEMESEGEVIPEIDRLSAEPNDFVDIQTPEKQRLLANSFIRSPSQQETDASSPAYLPPSQAPPPGFRTTLSYFVPLATLQSHFALSVDVLATVINATDVTRATSGPRDYNQTIFVTDPSSFSSKAPTTTTQIFRSHAKSFPIVEKGDAILLRDFKVQSFQGRLSLLSTQSSAWACFRQHSDVQVPGPPVEFGPEERGFARGLWRWWDGLSNEVKHTLYQAIPGQREGKKKSGLMSIEVEKEGSLQGDGTVRNDIIQGLGVELPGSQSKKRMSSLEERSLGLDGMADSTKSTTRVLRPRGT